MTTSASERHLHLHDPRRSLSENYKERTHTNICKVFSWGSGNGEEKENPTRSSTHITSLSGEEPHECFFQLVSLQLRNPLCSQCVCVCVWVSKGCRCVCVFERVTDGERRRQEERGGRGSCQYHFLHHSLPLLSSFSFPTTPPWIICKTNDKGTHTHTHAQHTHRKPY